MTEDMNQNQVMPADMAQPQAVAPQIPQEKMVPQSEVEKIVGAVRAEAREKGRAEAMMAQQSAPQQNMAAQQMAQGAMSEEQVRKMIAEQTLQMQQEQLRTQRAEQIVGEFAAKMDAGKDAYEDFDDTVKQLDLRTIPGIVQLANSVPNTADVMYDLGKNPYKVAQLEILLAKSPHLAKAEMARLANSITSNKQAVNTVSTREPLSQMKPSAASIGNGGPTSVRDFKSQPWLRR